MRVLPDRRGPANCPGFDTAFGGCRAAAGFGSIEGFEQQ